MEIQNPENLEQDPRFPSGPWIGFFLQYWMPGRHATNVEMTCSKGRLSGTGEDWVGPYTIEGRYDLRSGRCEWTKQYIGRHSVEYRGVNEGRGIWGVWEMKQLWGLLKDRGGFHIWPDGADVQDESDEAEKTLLELMRKEFGGRLVRALPILLVIAGVAAGLAFFVRKILEK
jgi:hypothetical protein